MGRPLLTALLAPLLLAPSAGAAEPELVDGIAAQVGTEVVLISDVKMMSGGVVDQMRRAGASEREIAMVQADALERLIERRLIMILARRAEVGASDIEIDEAIEAIANDNGISVEALRQSVEAQGLPFESYRERVSEEIIQRKVLGGNVQSKVKVEDSQVRELYDKRYSEQPTEGDEVWIRHIVVAVPEPKPELVKEACAAVQEAEKRVRAGEDFMTVATEVSMLDPDLGWVYVDSLADWMQEALAPLAEGEVSKVVGIPVGCSLLQVVERREVKPITYDEAKDQLRGELYEQAFDTEVRAFLERLRDQTYIERKGVFAEAARLSIPSAEGDAERRPEP